MNFRLLPWIAATACGISIAGASFGAPSGADTITGNICEWQAPTPKFVRDPAFGSDGNLYFAVKLGDKITRFDPESIRFKEWDIPKGTLPNGVVVATDGKVIFGGSGNGTINELDPVTGKLEVYKTPSIDSDPYTLALDAQGNVWFTEREAGNVGKLERSSGKITEYRVGSAPYAVAVDKQGNIWVSRRKAGLLVKLDPTTGKITQLNMGLGSMPRRIAVSQDGMLWVALYGAGMLAKVDPAAGKVVKKYVLPGGPNGGPYAVSVDQRGRIWVNEIQTDSVIMLDPRTEAMRVFRLPSKNSGVRNAAIDADGNYWYLGSYIGTVGVIK